jgi:hypothetical protein
MRASLYLAAKDHEAPTEAHAPLVMKALQLPILSVTAAVTGSPCGTGEVPHCAGGASPSARESSDKRLH